MNFTTALFRIAAIATLLLIGQEGLGLAATPGGKFSREMLLTRQERSPVHPATAVPLGSLLTALRQGGPDFALSSRSTAAAAWLVAEPAAELPALADSSTGKGKKKKNPTGAMVRSILIPGWGQFYNGKYFKAVAVFAIETGIVASAIYLDQLASDSKTEEEKAYYLDQRNARYWWLLLAKLLSMLDAYVDAQLSDFDESPSLSITPGIGLPARGGYAVRLGVRF